jgi:serine/threonine protein kinase
MAPEQIEGKEITPETDIYSLGLVMFRLVTLRLPFEADTQTATLLKRLQEPAPSPQSLCPGLDDSWSETILKCLEREPAKRFGSVRDVELALTGQLNSSPSPGARKTPARLEGTTYADKATARIVEKSVGTMHAPQQTFGRRFARRNGCGVRFELTCSSAFAAICSHRRFLALFRVTLFA